MWFAIPLEFIEKIYAHHPITEPIITAINPEAEMELVKEFAVEIGYPI